MVVKFCYGNKSRTIIIDVVAGAASEVEDDQRRSDSASEWRHINSEDETR